MTIVSEARRRYEQWLHDVDVDVLTKEELKAIADQPSEIEDRFYKELEFGTGGLRGVIGAGTNRINIYTIGKATQGFAQYIQSTQNAPHSVVIAYDSRHQSPEFALEAALVLAGNGITAYVFRSLRPTPELSFAVRELQASGGIVITASHNPPEYNGYKVYGADGGQLIPSDAERVITEIQNVHSFTEVNKLTQAEAEANGLLRWIGEEVDGRFIQAVTSLSCNAELIKSSKADFKIVYTPLHGAGNLPVRNALHEIGFSQVLVVAEQERPDPKFSTVKSPNPEEKEAFSLAIELAKQENADIIIGTDPDCDRMGAVVRDADGQFVVLTGNQSGALMIHYVLSHLQQSGKLPANGVVIKTIVTSEMGATIARHYGVHVMNTLTGFKYIGEKMTEFEQIGSHQFVFGYEESYGYLAGNYARDKDAVLASMLICEAAAFYKSQGTTLYDELYRLYDQFGYFLEKLESRTLKGKDGIEQINKIMDAWRSTPPTAIMGLPIRESQDYALGIDGLPEENVLKYTLADGSWFCLRPSGTEPKIKVYFAVQGDSEQEAAFKMEKLAKEVMVNVDRI